MSDQIDDFPHPAKFRASGLVNRFGNKKRRDDITKSRKLPPRMSVCEKFAFESHVHRLVRAFRGDCDVKDKDFPIGDGRLANVID